MFIRRIRSLLLQLLLLAVFFNTAIGLPLHEAGHLQQALGGVVQSVDSNDRVDPPDPEHVAEGQGVCAWCLAFAQPANLPATVVAWSATLAPEAQPHRPAAVAFVPGPVWWPFAARDPPQESA